MKNLKSASLSHLLASLPIAAGTLIFVLAFQNCAGFEAHQNDISGTYSSSLTNPLMTQAPQCAFDGQFYQDGDSVTAYLSPVASPTSTCQSQTRTCSNGSFSGSYNYASCQVSPGNTTSPCLFNGQTVPHGGSVKAYRDSSVAYGQNCEAVAESRSCNNGQLLGSYSYASCQVASAKSCLFNGMTYLHGQAVVAYKNSSASSQSECDQHKEARVCDNGAFTGTFIYASCAVKVPNSCTFNGQTIPHGGSVMAFQNSTVSFGSVCNSQQRICNDGSLSGNYNFASCDVGQPVSCLFDGKTIVHGESIVAYQTSTVPYGSSCATIQQTRECNNGSLSGSYAYGSCQVSSPKACLFDGKTISHGQSITAYSKSSVDPGQSCDSLKEVRTCSDGTLSGSFIYASCQTNATSACYLEGRTIPDGSMIQAYKDRQRAFGFSCASSDNVEIRWCKSGVLSGSYPHVACDDLPFQGKLDPQQMPHCSLGDQLLPRGTQARAPSNVELWIYTPDPRWPTTFFYTGITKNLTREFFWCDDYGQLLHIEKPDVPSPSTSRLQKPSLRLNRLSNSEEVSYPPTGHLYQSCEFNGKTYVDGTVIETFTAAKVGSKQSCDHAKQPFLCNNGKWYIGLEGDAASLVGVGNPAVAHRKLVHMKPFNYTTCTQDLSVETIPGQVTIETTNPHDWVSDFRYYTHASPGIYGQDGGRINLPQTKKLKSEAFAPKCINALGAITQCADPRQWAQEIFLHDGGTCLQNPYGGSPPGIMFHGRHRIQIEANKLPFVTLEGSHLIGSLTSQYNNYYFVTESNININSKTSVRVRNPGLGQYNCRDIYSIPKGGDGLMRFSWW